MRLWGWFFRQSGNDQIPPAPPHADDELAEDVELRLREPAMRRKLVRYFSKLWQAYPDGVIVRLNTGHKKLAERGAQLRHRLGMEGDLDGFFALGGLQYRRTIGGRPSPLLSQEERDKLLETLRQRFPDGIPTVSAVQNRDHRLYLALRTIARKQSCTITEFLRRHGMMKKKPEKGVFSNGSQQG